MTNWQATMELNAYVVFDELSQFEPRIISLTHEKSLFNSVRLFGACVSDSLRGSICVVAPNDVVPNAQFFDNVLLVSPGFDQDDSAIQLGLSIITVNGWAGSVPGIFACLQCAFERLSAWDYELVSAVARRDSLNLIAKIVARELHNGFALMDTGLRPILVGGTIPDDIKDTIWEQVINVDYTPNETFDIPPEDLCFFEGRGRDPYFSDIPRYPNHHNLIANIFQGEETIATLNTTTDMPYPITQGQVYLFERARDAFEQAMSFQNYEAVDDPALLYYATSHIAGQQIDNKVFEQHLVEKGWKPSKPYSIYVAAGPVNTALEDARVRFCLVRIKAHLPGALALVYNKDIIIINQLCNHADASVVAVLKTLGLASGKSMEFTNVTNMQQAYGQAKLALKLACYDRSEPNCHSFEIECFDALIQSSNNCGDLGLYLCHPAMLSLYKGNVKDYAETLECVQCYIANGCNLAKAAASLSMHRNTLAYRIERAETLFDMCFDDLTEDSRMHIWLSCRILRALSRK